MVKLFGYSDVRMTEMDIGQSILGVDCGAPVSCRLTRLTERLKPQGAADFLGRPSARRQVKYPALGQMHG